MRKLNLVRQLTLWLGTLLLTIALHAPMVTAIAPPTRTLAQATAPEPTAPEPTNPESTEPDTANEPPTWAAGLAQYQQGHPAAAIAIWSAALASARATGDVAAAQQLLGGIGAVHLALEQYDPAITHLQAALALAEQQDQAENQAQLLSNLGIAYRALGQYQAAIAAHQTALAVAESLGDPAMTGQILTNLGNAYEAIGDYAPAIAQHQASLDIAHDLGDVAGEMIALNNLGALQARQGNYGTAVLNYRQSLALAEQTANPLGQAYARHNLGSALHSLGDVDQAITHYEQALPLARAQGDRRLEADILASLGLAWSDLDQFDQAEASYQSSLAIVTALDSPQAMAMVLNNLGNLAYTQADYDRAIGYLTTATNLLTELRQDLDDLNTVSVFDTQVLTYNLLQQVLVAQGDITAALEVAEQGRAQALIAQLVTQTQANPPTSRGARLGVKAEFTLADMQAVAHATNSTLVEYAIVPHDEFRFQGKQRGTAGELMIWVVSPTGNVHFHQVDWQDNPLNLERLVSRSRREMGVRGRSIEVVPLTEAELDAGLDNDAVLDSADNLDAATTNSGQNAAPQSDGFIYRQLRQLYDLLITPIAAELPTDPNQRVVMIPQGELFLVPFAALQTPDGTYLIEQHTLVTAPSIQVLALAQQVQAQRSPAPWQPQDWLIVGNPTMPSVADTAGNLTQLEPLPGAEQEAEAIAAMMQTEPLLGDAATEPTVIRRMEQARIIHLATHGLLDYGQSIPVGVGIIPGAIALAPTTDADGLLTSNELAALTLQADLAVLSACDTGRGRVTGDGVVGLSRALMTAGVPSVVVSLWAVPDRSTALMMQIFYQTLQQDGDRASALRQAMLATKAQFPAPQDWAAFLLMGTATAPST